MRSCAAGGRVGKVARAGGGALARWWRAGAGRVDLLRLMGMGAVLLVRSRREGGLRAGRELGGGGRGGERGGNRGERGSYMVHWYWWRRVEAHNEVLQRITNERGDERSRQRVEREAERRAWLRSTMRPFHCSTLLPFSLQRLSLSRDRAHDKTQQILLPFPSLLSTQHTPPRL